MPIPLPSGRELDDLADDLSFVNENPDGRVLLRSVSGPHAGKYAFAPAEWVKTPMGAAKTVQTLQGAIASGVMEKIPSITEHIGLHLPTGEERTPLMEQLAQVPRVAALMSVGGEAANPALRGAGLLKRIGGAVKPALRMLPYGAAGSALEQLGLTASKSPGAPKSVLQAVGRTVGGGLVNSIAEFGGRSAFEVAKSVFSPLARRMGVPLNRMVDSYLEKMGVRHTAPDVAASPLSTKIQHAVSIATGGTRALDYRKAQWEDSRNAVEAIETLLGGGAEPTKLGGRIQQIPETAVALFKSHAKPLFDEAERLAAGSGVDINPVYKLAKRMTGNDDALLEYLPGFRRFQSRDVPARSIEQIPAKVLKDPKQAEMEKKFAELMKTVPPNLSPDAIRQLMEREGISLEAIKTPAQKIEEHFSDVPFSVVAQAVSDLKKDARTFFKTSTAERSRNARLLADALDKQLEKSGAGPVVMPILTRARSLWRQAIKVEDSFGAAAVSGGKTAEDAAKVVINNGITEVKDLVRFARLARDEKARNGIALAYIVNVLRDPGLGNAPNFRTLWQKMGLSDFVSQGILSGDARAGGEAMGAIFGGSKARMEALRRLTALAELGRRTVELNPSGTAGAMDALRMVEKTMAVGMGALSAGAGYLGSKKAGANMPERLALSVASGFAGPFFLAKLLFSDAGTAWLTGIVREGAGPAAKAVGKAANLTARDASFAARSFMIAAHDWQLANHAKDVAERPEDANPKINPLPPEEE